MQEQIEATAQMSTLLPHEDQAAWQELHASLIECWQPANLAELHLVDQIAQNYWRMERNRRFEAAMLNTHAANEHAYRILHRHDRRAASACCRAVDSLRRLQHHRERKGRTRTEPVAALDEIKLANVLKPHKIRMTSTVLTDARRA